MIRMLVGARGLALLILAAGWASPAGLMPGEFFAWDQVGLMIVVLVSGFLVAHHHGHEPFDRQHVLGYARDGVRVFLPAYVVLLIAGLVAAHWWSAWPYPTRTLGSFARAIAFIDAPGALSAVSVLAQCAVAFLVAWWIWSRGAHMAWIAGLAVVCAIPALFGWGTTNHVSFSVAAPYFFAAVGLGLAWPRLEPALRERSTALSVTAAAVFTLLAMNLPAVRVAHGWSISSTPVGATWLDPLTAVLTIVFVLAVAAQAAPLQFLGSRPLTFLGRHWFVTYLMLPIAFAALT